MAAGAFRPTPGDPPIGPAARVVGAAVLVGLVAVTLWEGRQRAAREEAAPTAAALAAAAAEVGRGWQPGDRIAFAPVWAAQERWRFAEALRGHGVKLADAWIPTSPLTAWELDGVRRLWLLRAPLGYAQPTAGLGDVELRRAFDAGGRDGPANVELLRLRPPASTTVLDLGLALDAAETSREGPAAGHVERCRWDGSRQACPGEWWRSVSYGMHEAGHSRRRCVYATPHPDGATLRLRWPRVPPALAIAGRVGNRLWAVRHELGSDVLLRLRVGGALKHEQRLGRGDFAWHTFHAELAADERGATVDLEISADDHRWRQLCFELRLVGAVGSAGPAQEPPADVTPPAAAAPATPAALR